LFRPARRAGKAHRKFRRKESRDCRKNHLGGRSTDSGDSRKLCRLLDVLAPLRRNKEFEPLFAAVDPQGQVDFNTDRDGLFEKERRVGIVERGKDQSAGVAEIGPVIETADQAALAAPAFEELSLEKVSLPMTDQFRADRRRRRAECRAGRQGRAGAARLFHRPQPGA
jgi:hypothetical protein